MRPLTPTKLEGAAEQVRQSHALAIVELQNVPIVAAKVFSVVVPSNSYVTIAHGLGRAPKFISCSPPYKTQGIGPGGATAGEFVEDRDPPVNRAEAIRIGAFLWGQTIAFDVMVW